ncbi:structural protein, partial [Xenorhabdus bovienii]|nr:structural protein [Xenorhabdus bovienii]
MTRGLRNNNPGNIDHNPANKWQGQLPHDLSIEKRFCRFESPEYGIRALIKLLINYHGNGYKSV